MQQQRSTTYEAALVLILLGHLALDYILLPCLMEERLREPGLSRFGLKIGYDFGMVVIIGIMLARFNALLYYLAKRRKRQVSLLPVFCFLVPCAWL
jgi:hypothetical protein